MPVKTPRPAKPFARPNTGAATFRRWPSPAVVTNTVPDSVPTGAGEGLPFLVFCIYTFILFARPQDYFPWLAPLRPGLVFTFIASLLSLSLGQTVIGNAFRHKETKLYLWFFAAMLVGVPFSLHRRVSLDFVLLSYIVNLVFYVLFVVHVTTIARFRRLAFVLMLSTLMFSVLGLQKGSFSEGRYEVVGGMFDPNDLAFVIICLLPYSLYILLGSFSRLSRLLAFVSTMAGVILCLYSGSRGGLIGLGIFFLSFLFVKVEGLPKKAKLVIVAALLVGAGLNADRINIDRYRTLVTLDNDYNTTTEFGRFGIWERGLAIFADNPVVGVGVDRFGQAIGETRLGDNEIPEWQAPHNSYLQVIVETGLLGALPFLLLIISCLAGFFRLSRKSAAVADSGLGAMPAFLFFGLIAQLLTAVFLSQAYSLFFTLAFACCAVLKAIVAAPEPSAVSHHTYKKFASSRS